MTFSLLVLTALVGFPQGDAGAGSVVETGAKLEKLWGEGSFTEGGALDQDGTILFSDIGNRIMRFDPKTGQTTVFREPSGRANGMIFDKPGPADRRRGGQHRRRPPGLDHRARRHGPHPRRQLRQQAVQQPQRRRRRPRGPRLCLRPPLRRRRAPRARFRGRLPDRRCRATSSRSDHGASNPTAWPSLPTRRRSTSPTTAPAPGI